jgi:type III pantothenate kinase
MSESPGSPAAPAEMLAIDVGSSCVKLGRFASAHGCTSDKPASALPIAAPKLVEPTESFTVEHGCDLSGTALAELEAWLEENFAVGPQCYLASVRPVVTERLLQVFKNRGWSVPRQLTWKDLPLEVRVEEPSRVGIDRLLNAVAANRLRERERPAIVVDLGTAGTVDLVAADGAFKGGTILPGMSLAAQALHTGTSSLPEFDITAANESVDVVGKNTKAAIAAGLFWGTVGATSELIARISRQCQPAPQLFVTGGAAEDIVKHLSVAGVPARHVRHMVLSAIQLVGEHLQ